MNPVYNTFCAVLEEAHLLTHDAAKALAVHMQNNIHQSKYEDALDMVRKSSEAAEQFAVQPWQADITALEGRVKELEAKLAKAPAKK